MLCKTFASPIQLVSSENLLLENFISWEKSCETGEFLSYRTVIMLSVNNDRLVRTYSMMIDSIKSECLSCDFDI